MAKSTVASLRDPPNVAEQPPRLGQHSPRHALGNGPGHHRELHRGPQRQGCRAHRRRPLGHRPRADILRGVPRYAMPVSGGPEATALHDLAVDRHGGHLASARRALSSTSHRAHVLFALTQRSRSKCRRNDAHAARSSSPDVPAHPDSCATPRQPSRSRARLQLLTDADKQRSSNAKGGSRISPETAFDLGFHFVAGAGFEPATSGL